MGKSSEPHGPLLVSEVDTELASEFARSHDWFIKHRHQRAVQAVLNSYVSIKSYLHQRKTDFAKIEEWKKEVEETKRKLGESERARRGLERANARLEQEAAEAKTAVDNQNREFTKEEKKYEDKIADKDGIIQQLTQERAQFQSNFHNERSLVNDLKLQVERLNAEYKNLDSSYTAAMDEFLRMEKQAAEEKSRYQESTDNLATIISGLQTDLAAALKAKRDVEERLHGVALNAKQIQIIIEKDLEIINGHATEPHCHTCGENHV